MATGLEALGAASAVLQVISIASDLVVACKNTYDGVTTPQDDLERHSKQMFEAVGRVHARCERMATENSQFADPELHNIAKDCKDAAKGLRVEVQCVTNLQAEGNLFKSIRKAIRASRHQRKLRALEDSLSRHQQLIQTELASHLCDVQLLVNKLAQGVSEVKNLMKKEHAVTRAAVTQETTKAEKAINTHTDAQMLDLRTMTERNQQCVTFLKSLKAERMNQRYTNIVEPEDASFNQVFASYEEMLAMYFEDSDDCRSEERDYPGSDQSPDSEGSEHDDDSEERDYSHEQGTQDDNEEDDNDDLRDYSNSEVDQSSEGYIAQSHVAQRHGIWSSWDSFVSWLQSDEKLFYISGKPGCGKSTLVKFITHHHRTRELIQERNPDAMIIRYYFWKIGSHEENSIKGLWCSLLYQRLERQSSLIQDVLHYFQHLSSHASYHDWTIKDLQTA
ncbi:hypothetical protein NW752_003295 [Fusarium irregulare]|uniref:Nephrocystin 3-like N-terminal domain-containing protein n=1 Tax=Fusarium irregulare TaxID=2494466 RepID=A0A9W8PT08_9HYPO|nr:hypothetical protein NW766_004364 [Fusarium irregulare]KAJ4022841.1 hypothetical protein NW752_003295 [Fusarium irregulare]